MNGLGFDFQADDAPLSVKVIEEVARFKGKEPEALEPALTEAVDPDALDGLFAEDGRYSTDPAFTVSFRYSGCDVTVERGGHVHVRAVERAGETASFEPDA